ncbi:polysaccharide biosynthesis tyrosine autokinase [Staphylococcus carnosus]|uniref:non-specific protein-tyrosine kinase n=2 Tax=Staphylococcus carnosus TaxID=1281 RepID=B9DIM2_STACT|nr:polysaccharide biosynthesis tyrosine autokinase [Staphylococcus carnosus]QPT03015.1 polysaccharide biosynthesis tyrosine autokinase [Staphylococcus carnosus]UQA68018.1 polysaccharide biosynthesis tyrosine autokinase [Staphylococcus carnosus]UTB77163.1 capsular biosynthesis protein [Staphylococcus carnosus]UTB86710.1 capsular biosynthesis protein [Staphylococcus carnosus]UTB89057.1 capsular biosynthesis protein [Staphylococcus carnosus]
MSKKNKTTVTTNPLITSHQPRAVTSEKFRGIRTNITFSTADKDVKGIVFTSEKPSAGKPTISANVAITFAQAGHKTLLLDGDMRKPTQHYLFNVPNILGLSNLITQNESLENVINRTDIENLDILTSGPIPPNPSELIGSVQFQKIYEELNKVYDHIIIDTPPINTVTDAQLYAETSGHVVYVLDAKSNDRNSVKKGKELIEKTGAKILGVVLNRASSDKSSSYYSYYGEEE